MTRFAEHEVVLPIVVITGQVAYSVIGTDAFQEADTFGLALPVTKHNWLVTDPQDIPTVTQEPCRDIFGEGNARVSLDGDVVVVVNPAEVIQTQVARP